jgi:predicted permease
MDLRYSLRMLWKNPGFTAVAVIALALGIGANTAIFTVVDGVLLQPLPFAEPDRLMRLCRLFPGGHYASSNSIPKYMVWRGNHVFSAMTLYSQGAPGMNFGPKDHPEQVKAAQVSDGYFQVFGVAPLIGRTFTASEDVPGGPKLAVLGYHLWQSRLGGDRELPGRTIQLNNEPYTVIGVLPKGFQADPPVDLWVPLQADAQSTNQGHYLAAAARLKPGVTLEAARAEMKIVGEQFRRQNPKWMEKDEGVGVVPMREAITGDIRPALWILLGAVGFVLLIACANVANLLLARAAVRAREMAVRAAIGAGRWRVVRQLLTESLLLAGIGGVAGFALGAWGVRALLLLAPGNIPRLTDPDGFTAAPPLDWRVAGFTIGVALLTGVLFGLFPALRISNPDLASVLKDAGSRGGTGRHTGVRSLLVITEMALALVLLVGAALLIRTFVGLQGVKPGFEAHNVLTLTTSLTGSAYGTTERVDNMTDQMIRRLEAVPGVEAAASCIALPASSEIDLPFNIVGRAPAKGDTYEGGEQYRTASPHYFRALGIPLLRGRVFNQNDRGNTAPVVIINESMAKKYWPKQDPIGQVMVIGKGLGPQFDDPPRQVVGIVGTVRETGLQEANPGVMYIPEGQVPQGITTLANQVIPLSWVIKTAAAPMNLRSAVESEFRAFDPGLVPAQPKTMEAVLAQSVARQNFNMLLLTIFAAIALLLASIGIYGLMSYTVEQRTQEIGIRMALGAAGGDMLKMVIRQGMTLVGIGVAAGLAIAYGVTRYLASMLFGVKSSDPWTFAAVALVLTMVALLATYIPARRAAATPPSEALRYQ